MALDPRLIGDLFDACIDNSRWAGVLDGFIRKVDAITGVVISVDLAKNTGFQGVWHTTSFTPQVMDYYNKHLSNYEADGIPIIANSARFQILTENDLWGSDPSLYERPDFVWFRENVGFNHRIVARISEDKSWFNTLTVQFD